jgi:hypothetical protein
MKKKFSLEIKTPCHENFSKMTANERGSFCNSCAKNVIDLSTKTNSEVATFISNNKDANICARMRTSQLEEEFVINETSAVNNLKYAVAVAASILLTSNVVGQEKSPIKTEVNCPKPNPGITMGKVAYVQPKKEVISFTLQGKVLEKATKKPLSEKKYPNMTIYVSGLSESVNPKTGVFSLQMDLNKNTKEIRININCDDYTFSKTYTIDFNAIKNGILNLDILIDSEKEMQNYKIMGGLGVNYIDTKKSNPFS